MNSRRRAILEAIVDSDDASASEKLQAIALLHGDGPEPTSRRDLSHLTDEELDASLDEHLAADLSQLVAAELEGVQPQGIAAEMWAAMPRVAAALAAEVERRAEARARGHTD
jgi:hypothetical protein